MGKKKTAAPERTIQGAKPFDPLLMYIQARAFQALAKISGDQPQRSLFMFPTVALEAFSLELHLKCLLAAHGIMAAREHDNRRLFGMLPNSDRDTIATYLLEFVRLHPTYQACVDRGVDFDPDSVAARAANTFVSGRYWYELKLPAGDDKGWVANYGVTQMSQAINRLLLERYPGWVEKVENFRLLEPQLAHLPTSPAHQTPAPVATPPGQPSVDTQ